MAAISVAICTHKPRLDYLSRALDALKKQTLPTLDWEFIIIDNASAPPVSETVDLTWHPNARMIVEPQLGIVHARLRAMREFNGTLLVFLDDDNVLAEDYLARCLELFAERPDLGAASGCLMPEYEAPPPKWFGGDYESWIAVRRISNSRWSNFLDPRSEPVTAGMCLRRTVTEAHLQWTTTNTTQRVLGSRGASLMRGEDVAIAKTALRLGYTVGQFAQLQALHLISKRRSDPAYLFSLYRHLCASGHLLSWADQEGREPIRLPLRTVARSIYRLVRGSPIRRRMVIEEIRGFQMARKIAREWANGEFTDTVPERKTNA